MQQRLELVKEINHLGYRAISERVSALIHESLHTLSTKTKVFTMHRSPHGTTALTATAATAGDPGLATEASAKGEELGRGRWGGRNPNTIEQNSRRKKLLQLP